MPRKRRQRAAAAPGVEEDELLLLQSQALAEEEAAKKKGEMLTQFLKDKLAKEEHNSALNLNKINTQWRAVLREAKAEELRADIEILSQTFARVTDCKDSVIRSLARDLLEAEAQHGRALCSHLHNIDRLLQLQRCRLRYLQDDYNAELAALREEFETERRAILEQHEQERCYLQGVMLAAEQSFVENDCEATLNFQSAWDDVKSKQLEEKQYSRLQLGSKVDSLWKQFQQVLHSYAEATEDQKIAFEVLKQKDEKSSREIEMQAKKLHKLQDSIAAVKGRITDHLQESKEQNRCMREEKELVLGQLQELKREMNQARAKARGSLAELTARSSAALKALLHVVAKAERVLRLGEMCRKLESEEEKVLPFYPSSLAEEEQRDVEQVLRETPAEPLAQAMQDYAGLERFWQRFNKAKLEELALARERAALSRRNGRLRELLAQYLEGVSVSPELLRKPNPLLTLQHSSCSPRARRRAGGAVHNVVEAAHVASRIL
ncbi:dynein regulatory complex subunit 2 isoform X2 [Dromaius novaehollandiae]